MEVGRGGGGGGGRGRGTGGEGKEKGVTTGGVHRCAWVEERSSGQYSRKLYRLLNNFYLILLRRSIHFI